MFNVTFLYLIFVEISEDLDVLKRSMEKSGVRSWRALEPDYITLNEMLKN